MEEVRQLVENARIPFSTWPVAEVPLIAAGVYTIWAETRFIYVGMAGRGLTAADLRLRSKTTGLFSRLASHASGRRSGDQFCLLLCDRFVLPMLSPAHVEQIAQGSASLDTMTRDFIRGHLSFSWRATSDGATALALERTLRRGESSAGPPFLNPIR